MCACCLANFLLHEPYQACQGPACQAWRHTPMLERRAKQALQSALPSGFWGMPPPAPPQTDELEPWQFKQPPQPQSGNAPPPAGDVEPWQMIQRPQPHQPESVWTTRTRIQRVPRCRRRRAPGQALGYAAPSCGLNALWFGVLSVIRTSSCSSSCSSNRASHSTAARCSDGLAQDNCATVQ